MLNCLSFAMSSRAFGGSEDRLSPLLRAFQVTVFCLVKVGEVGAGFFFV
jgi:hypothetical protein